jgi:hypothetical protein
MNRVPLAALLVLLAIPAADAGIKTTRLGAASIAYDTEIWQALPPGAPGAAVIFTCTAPGCAGSPKVYAMVIDREELARDLANSRRDARVLADIGVPPLPFLAYGRWSGCRTRDEPILVAAGELGGEFYRFTTSVAVGCNFSPPLPVPYFLDLVRGLEIGG